MRFYIAGKPIAKARPKFFRRGNFVGTYNSQETEESKWLWQVKSQLEEEFVPLSGPVAVNLEFFFPYPKAFPKRKREGKLWNWNTKKPDIDNCAKFALDCLRDVVMGDDACVVKMEITKMYGEIPGTVIEIEGME